MSGAAQTYGEGAFDRALASATPVYPVAQDGSLPKLVPGAHCYLLARDGLYVAGRSDTVAAVIRVAELPRQTSFGAIQERLELINGPVPFDLLEACASDAIARSPIEWGGAIVADAAGGYEYFEPVADGATPVSLTYRRDSYPDERLVVDLHSHGEGPAYFSPTDDASDAEGIHVAVVLGRCQRAETLEMTSRLTINGWFREVPAGWWLTGARVAAGPGPLRVNS
ncbi:MAG: PRTRC system protein A [Salinisphaeraceae bacterium]